MREYQNTDAPYLVISPYCANTPNNSPSRIRSRKIPQIAVLRRRLLRLYTMSQILHSNPAIRRVKATSWLSQLHAYQQVRHATLLRRPKRPYTFTQLVTLSDGSCFLHRTTSPLPIYKSTKDARNSVLWNPSSQKLLNVEEDEAGRLRAFRARFGRGWDADNPANENEVSSAVTAVVYVPKDGRHIFELSRSVVKLTKTFKENRGDESSAEATDDSLLDLLSGSTRQADGQREPTSRQQSSKETGEDDVKNRSR